MRRQTRGFETVGSRDVPNGRPGSFQRIGSRPRIKAVKSGSVPDKPIQGQLRRSKAETTRNIYMQTVAPETWKAVVNLEESAQPKKGKAKPK
jgi:hypothetical protein